MKVQSLKVNFIMNAVLTVSNMLFPLITFPYVSRVLMAAGTGKVAFATSLITYFSMFAQLGIPTYGIRACARVRDDRDALSKTVQELLSLSVCLSLLAYGAFIVALSFVPRLQGEKLLYVVVSTSIFFNAIGMEWLYKGMEQYTYITCRSMVFKTIALAATFLLIRSSDDYVFYAGISIFATSASNVMNLIHARKYINLRRYDSYDYKRHLKPILVFFAMSFATTIYTHLDTLLLGFLTSDEVVGYFDAASKIKAVLVSFVTSLAAVLLPRASYYVERQEMQKFWALSKKALKVVVVLSFPMVIYFIIYAEECILFLVGDGFRASILPMQIITPTVLFIGVSNIIGIQMLVPLGEERIVLLSELVGLVVNIILNVLLIPRMGVAGAAVAVSATELVVTLVQIAALRKQLEKVFCAKELFGVLFGITAAGFVALLLKPITLAYFFKLALSAFCFFLVYGIVILAFYGKEFFSKAA